jgi:hypothetical protein
MVRATNANNVLASQSPLPGPKKRTTISCTACGCTGHQRSSATCPKRSRLGL